MLRVTLHRGPDGVAKTFLRRGGGFAVSRLAIVGTEVNNQPLSNRRANVAVVNGEIYNFLDLIDNPKLQGAIDTDAVLPAFQTYGYDVINHLDGQFALAIADQEKGEILLARDYFGEQPLFYFSSGSLLAFASEAKAILALPLVACRPNINAILASAFAYGPPLDQSVFRGIEAVPPGQMLRFDSREPHAPTCVARIGIPAIGTFDGDLSLSLVEAVRKRTLGNSRPAFCISGGLDSSLLVALAADTVSAPLDTFSLRFADTTHDEGVYINQVVEHCGSCHHEVFVDADSIADDLFQMIIAGEVPLSRTAPIPLLRLASAIHQNGHKFVITGEGADELFRGYSTFARRLSSFRSKANILAEVLDVLRTELRVEVGDRAALTGDLRVISAGLDLEGEQIEEINTKLSRFLLSTQGDRPFMQYGVEVRHPFLDLNVARSASRCAVGMTYEDKAPLRGLARNILPRTIADRPKFPYLAPAPSYSGMDFRDRVDQLFSVNSLQRVGIFDAVAVAKKYESFRNRDFLLSENEGSLLLFVLSCQSLFSHDWRK